MKLFVSIKAYLRLLKLCLSTNPIPVKYAARKIGLPVGEFNLPMCEPTTDEAAYIDKALTEYLQ